MDRGSGEFRDTLQRADAALKQSKTKDYYKILGVPRSAGEGVMTSAAALARLAVARLIECAAAAAAAEGAAAREGAGCAGAGCAGAGCAATAFS